VWKEAGCLLSFLLHDTEFRSPIWNSRSFPKPLLWISLLGVIPQYYASCQLPEEGNVVEVPKRSLCTAIPMKDCLTLIHILFHFSSVKAKDVFL